MRLFEISTVTVYHGDNYNTINLKHELMNNGNNQEGIGIYFTDNIETARSYGKNVVKTTINMNKFVHSRDIASDHIPKQRIIELLQILTNINQEDMFYYMSDYTELTKPTDIDYGTCFYIAGCTDSTAFNYNSNACYDDGSCIAVALGCTDSSALN